MSEILTALIFLVAGFFLGRHMREEREEEKRKQAKLNEPWAYKHRPLTEGKIKRAGVGQVPTKPKPDIVPPPQNPQK